MLVLELNQVELDYCEECGGIWLDAGELEQLLGGCDSVRNLLDSVKASETGERREKCPICGKKMDKVEYGSGKPVILDKCVRNHGLWFDKGELLTVMQSGGIAEGDEVMRLLRDMFGKQ